MALLCTYHHRLLHEGAFGIVKEADEPLRFVTADRRTIPRCGYRREDFVDDGVDDNANTSAEGFCTTADIVFEHPQPTPIIAMLHLHPGCRARIRRDEYLLVDPQVPLGDYLDGFGNRCSRLTSPAGQLRFWNDAVLEDDGRPEAHSPTG